MCVSVCIATYNGEKYIKEQITSILVQLKEDDEIVVSDDFSKDATCDVIRSLNDKRILLIENQFQSGLIKNFEKALKASKGDYIFLSDQDDKWLPNKIEVVLKYLENYAVVQSDAVIVDEDLKVLQPSSFQLMNSKPGLLKNFLKNNYMGCCMAFNRRVLNIALPFPAQIPMHDQWIGLIGELFFTTYFIQDKLVLYRRHVSNASDTGSKSKFSLVKKIKFRINIIRHLPLVIIRRIFANRFKID